VVRFHITQVEVADGQRDLFVLWAWWWWLVRLVELVVLDCKFRRRWWLFTGYPDTTGAGGLVLLLFLMHIDTS
jgi:hypothetical protein